MKIDWSECPVLESIPGKVSGAWVFRGTRVPVWAIFRNLPQSMPDLLEAFPSVTREQIECVMEFLAKASEPVYPPLPVDATVVHVDPA